MDVRCPYPSFELSAGRGRSLDRLHQGSQAFALTRGTSCANPSNELDELEERQIRVEQLVAEEERDDAAEREERRERDPHLPRGAAVAGEQDDGRARARRSSRPSARPARCGRAWRRAGARASRRPCPSPSDRPAPRGRGRATRRRRRAPTPRSARARSSPTSTIAAAGRTITLGTIRCERSVAETATSVAQKKAATNDLPEQPKAKNEAAIRSAVSELDGRVDDADLRSAAPAAAAEREIGEDRDVLVPGELVPAAHAGGAGRDDRALQRDAGGDDVQETADREARGRTRRRRAAKLTHYPRSSAWTAPRGRSGSPGAPSGSDVIAG